ncbi:hypothetical protein JKP88DRAFT_350626 [Tribonema minus]|uniref:Nuclear transport factor 2 n=1 Tax=Tribonema minus TaxID=303371 RepID=A0A836CA84_9STRA|nr:hypothetical protein JKP88DRAFT_350626 [Tribonema minus]
MSAEEVAKAFAQHFYQTFTANAQSLAPLYNDRSMLTFEGQASVGAQAIIQKYVSIGKLAFDQNTLDVQPSVDANAICIHITGKVKIDSNNPIHYTQFFQLVASGPSQYYVHNDIFRLVYA